MTSFAFSEFQATLSAMQDRLEALLRKRDGIAVERSPDSSDEAQYALDRDLTIRVLDRESRLLTAVKLALRRIEDDTFGICLRCEEHIGAKRLAAIPWAAFCIRCQEFIDQAPQDRDEPALSLAGIS